MRNSRAKTTRSMGESISGSVPLTPRQYPERGKEAMRDRKSSESDSERALGVLVVLVGDTLGGG